MNNPVDHHKKDSSDTASLNSDRPTANGALSDDTQLFMKPREQRRNIPLTARALLQECESRSLAESAELLLAARAHLWNSRQERGQEHTSTQVKDLVFLPQQGTAYFFTDLEGRCEILASVFDEEKIIERWQKNDPNDQVFVCILGDSINRSQTGSVLMEFLLDLKCRRGFSRQLIILPGNHELCPGLQKRQGGLLSEILFERESYQHCGDPYDPRIKAAYSVSAEPRFLGPARCATPATVDEALYAARVGMWHLFTDIFHSLPKSILSCNGIYAAHAGFPTRGAFASLFGKHPLEAHLSEGESEGSELSSPNLLNLSHVSPGYYTGYLLKPSEDLANDMTWSDLNPSLDLSNNAPLLTINTRGAADSPLHGIAFGVRAFTRFAETVGASVFLRGHQEQFPASTNISSPRSDLWLYENIVTFTSRILGGYAKVDLSKPNPEPDDIIVVSAPIDL